MAHDSFTTTITLPRPRKPLSAKQKIIAVLIVVFGIALLSWAIWYHLDGKLSQERIEVFESVTMRIPLDYVAYHHSGSSRISMDYLGLGGTGFLPTYWIFPSKNVAPSQMKAPDSDVKVIATINHQGIHGYMGRLKEFPEPEDGKIFILAEAIIQYQDHTIIIRSLGYPHQMREAQLTLWLMLQSLSVETTH